jgi:Fe-S cluster biosynthesis and repair protein YggX
MNDIQQFYCIFAYIQKIVYSNARKYAWCAVICDKSVIINKEKLFEVYLKNKKKLKKKPHSKNVTGEVCV